MLNERSDVYSFGILIMEIISGRNPVNYSRPPEEVNMISHITCGCLSRSALIEIEPYFFLGELSGLAEEISYRKESRGGLRPQVA